MKGWDQIGYPKAISKQIQVNACKKQTRQHLPIVMRTRSSLATRIAWLQTAEGDRPHVKSVRLWDMQFTGARNHTSCCHEHIIQDGIQKFPQIPTAPVLPHAKLETKPPIQTNDSQF